MSRFIPFQIKPLIKKAFALIGEDENDEETLKSIQVLENIALRLIITRRGHRQDESTYVQPYYHLNNYLIRFISILTFIRLYLFLVYKQNDNLNILLANPFYRKDSSDMIIYFVIGGGITLFVLREYILYLEETGAFALLSTLRDIKFSGFDKTMLRLTTKQCGFFRSTFHHLITMWIRMIYGALVLAPLLCIGIRINNQEIINSGPKMYISSVFWILLESHTFIFIFGGLTDLGAHIIILVPLYLCQLKSLIELLKRFKSKQLIDDSIIKGMNTNVIRYMNYFEDLIYKIRYLFFFLFVIVSFGADSAIFLGLFIRSESNLMSNIFTTFGLLTLCIVGSVAYAGGAYLDQLYVIHGLYVSIIAKAKVKLEQKLKTLEILDRILGPYSGAKIGDAFTAERLLAVFYVLENASTILLLICNFQRTST